MQVTWEEFIDVLDAYGIISEEEWIKGRTSVSKWTLICLVNKLNEWELTIDEIFDLFWVNSISVEDFVENVLKSNLKLKLKIREEFALINLLDLNKDGYIEWSDCWSIINAGQTQI